MERIGDEVQRELLRFGASGPLPAVVAAWPAAVGDEVARNAWPARVGRDGVLHVNTSSSAWAFELTQLAGVVLEQLVAALGKEAPAGLRFAPGPVPEQAAVTPEEQLGESAKPSAESLREADALAAGISDSELRDRVARAAALSLERARSDRCF